MIVRSTPPVNLGTHSLLSTPELMFVQYMPVRMPGTDVRIPPNLQCFKPLVDVSGYYEDEYVYLTAKHIFVTPDNPGNRPGWHIDGYGTTDINLIWYSSMPTEFCVQDFNLWEDHEGAMRDMEQQAKPENIKTYPPGSLLILTNKIVHRTAECKEGHYRTFVKISLSKDQYNLKGNAHNYLFDYSWNMVERGETRNHTTHK
jgi:hypothetical protein